MADGLCAVARCSLDVVVVGLAPDPDEFAWSVESA